MATLREWDGSQWVDVFVGVIGTGPGSGLDADTVDGLHASAFGLGSFRKFSSGLFYPSDIPSGDSTVVPVVGTLIVAPFTVGATTTFDRISLEVTATFAASVARLGIYADLSGVPNALVLDAGTVDTATSTGNIANTISLTLTPGLYWLGMAPQVSATAATVRCRTQVNSFVGQSNGGNANVNGYSRTGVASFLPSIFGAVTPSQVGNPKVTLRAQ